MRFKNYETGRYEAECAEQGQDSMLNFGPRRIFTDKWFIKMGFAGFNSPKNNGSGYETKAKAEAACLRYQSK